MVLKKSKFGGNTGNTLRKHGKGMVESLKTSSYITKTSSNCPSNTWIDDGDLGSDKCGSLNQPTESVKYSLKKKSRWNLPEHLSNEIKDFTSKKEAFADTKGLSCKDETILVLKRPIGFKPKHYSEYTINQAVKSVQYSEEPGKDKSLSWKGNMKLEDTVDVKYTVECPIPFLWPYHTKSSVNNEHGKGNRSSHRRRNDSQFLLAEDEYEDLIDQEIYEDFNVTDEEEWVGNDVSSFRCKSETFPLGLFVKNNKKPQKILNRGKRKNDIRKNFTEYKIYVAENQQVHFLNKNEEVPEPEPSARKNVDNDIQEFSDYFNAHELQKEILQEMYRSSYVESNSYPRSFAVINYKQSDLSVVVNIHDDAVNNLQKLSLKIFSSSHIDLTNALLHGGSLNSLIEKLYQLNQSKSSTANKYRKAKTECSFITKILKPQVSIKTTIEMCQSVLLEANFNSQKLIKIDPYGVSYKNEDTSSNILCSICYIDTVSTRLRPCNHLFCDCCLKIYIEDHIYNKSRDIACPEFKCHMKLNIAFVMKFVTSNALFRMYYNKLVQNIILRDENLKQCPTPNCSHIAVQKMKKIIPSVVSCVCNKSWCFGCQNEEHWPASCELFERYQQQLQEDVGTILNQFGKIYRTNVQYRKCPFCGSSIIKNGGCNHMNCSICGKDFCWRCLKKLHRDKCEKVIGSEKVFTSLDLVHQPTSATVQVFRDAMKYKIKRKELSVLQTKLKLKRATSCLLNPNSLRAVINESLMIIDECYKVFEYCTLHRVNKKFKNVRYQNYVSLVCLYTSMLYDEISNKNLSKINKKRVIERKECLQNVIKKMIRL